MNAFTTFPPRRMTAAAIEALEDAERAEREAERDDYRAAVRAYENTFTETASCVEACFEYGATAHAPCCQRAQDAARAAVAAPIANALDRWLNSIRRAA